MTWIALLIKNIFFFDGHLGDRNFISRIIVITLKTYQFCYIFNVKFIKFIKVKYEFLYIIGKTKIYVSRYNIV